MPSNTRVPAEPLALSTEVAIPIVPPVIAMELPPIFKPMVPGVIVMLLPPHTREIRAGALIEAAAGFCVYEQPPTAK